MFVSFGSGAGRVRAGAVGRVRVGAVAVLVREATGAGAAAGRLATVLVPCWSIVRPSE